MTYRSRTAYGMTTEPAEDWRTQAACRDEDPELFFPVGHSGPAEVQIERALNVCRRCPVRSDCTQTAVERGETDGVWGVDPRELRRITIAREVNPADRRTVRPSHCRNQHLLTDESTYIDSRGSRSCKRCRADAEHQRRLAARAKAGVL